MTQLGGSLIELLIIVVLWSSLGSGLLVLHPRLSAQIDLVLASHQIFTTTHLAKRLALQSGNDQELLVQQNTLSIKGQSNFSSQLPLSVSLSQSSGRKLGFKANGNTKYAGTLQITSGPIQKKVSISVGPGRIHRK